MMKLEHFLIPTQKQLFGKICEMYADVLAFVSPKDFILVKGEAPVMLVAHMDTVHKEPVRDICRTRGKNILMSPQGIGGDDRCGVYALITVYENAPVKPWLLFTCDEEIGGLGAEAFCKKHREKKLPPEMDDLKAIIEIDRKGSNDAVYYDCGNDDFEDYITSKGFETDWGTFSDISVIAPELGVAAVNLSSGYYNAHTQHEYINRRELMATIRKVQEIVSDAAKPDFPKYEYIESYSYPAYAAYSGYYGWDSLDYPELDADLDKIPKRIRNEYEILMDYYAKEDLEEIREEMGDDAILKLFTSEFGKSYDDLFNK